MIYLKRNIWLTTFGIFITAAILFGGLQILNADEPVYYCPHPLSYQYNLDCLEYCPDYTKYDILACIFNNGTFKCCQPGQDLPWDCGCFVE